MELIVFDLCTLPISSRCLCTIDPTLPDNSRTLNLASDCTKDVKTSSLNLTGPLRGVSDKSLVAKSTLISTDITNFPRCHSVVTKSRVKMKRYASTNMTVKRYKVRERKFLILRNDWLAECFYGKYKEKRSFACTVDAELMTPRAL